MGVKLFIHSQNGIKNKKRQADNQTSAVVTPPFDESEKRSRSETPTTQRLSSPPFDAPLNAKLLTPPASFDAFFSRPHPSQFNFYPHHLLTQPLNFSTNRLPFPSMLSQIPPQSPLLNKSPIRSNNIEHENQSLIDDLCKKTIQEKRTKPSSLRKIDKIAETLRFGANSSSPPSSASPSSTKSFLDHFSQMSVIKKESSTSPHLHSASTYLNEKNASKPVVMENLLSFSPDAAKISLPGTVATTNSGPTTKIPNSKLFAKCFICSKLLSNQYNLRVHLETHQNMR